jgi:hypothetical protein
MPKQPRTEESHPVFEGRRENSNEDRKFCQNELIALGFPLQSHPLKPVLRGSEEGCKLSAVCSGEGR